MLDRSATERLPATPPARRPRHGGLLVVVVVAALAGALWLSVPDAGSDATLASLQLSPVTGARQPDLDLSAVTGQGVSQVLTVEVPAGAVVGPPAVPGDGVAAENQTQAPPDAGEARRGPLPRTGTGLALAVLGLLLLALGAAIWIAARRRGERPATEPSETS